jgi:3-oxoadipate enol-lactonase
MTTPSTTVPAWLPPGEVVHVAGRGEMFLRRHRHSNTDEPTVLLLHGWTASADLQFLTAYEALAQRWSFIGVDHRGHGRGLRPPVPFTLEECADDTAALLRTLGVGPVIAVGYSMGGPIALHLAHRHPDLVAGLVLQATALEWRASRRERAQWRFLRVMGWTLRHFAYPRWLQRGVERLIHTDHALSPYLPWMLGEIRRNDPWMMVEAGRALARYDARPWASTLKLPTAVTLTTGDRLVRPRKQRALARAMAAEQRVVPLDGDHLVPWEHPERFAAATVQAVDLVSQAVGSSGG